MPVFKTGAQPTQAEPSVGQGDWNRTSDLLGPGQARYHLRYTLMVWETGFEPATPGAQGRCSSQAELLPDKKLGGADRTRTCTRLSAPG